MEYLAFKALYRSGDALVSPRQGTEWLYDTQGNPCLIADGHGIYAAAWKKAAEYGKKIYLVIPYLQDGEDPEITLGTYGWRSSHATVIAGPWGKFDDGGMKQAAEFIITSYLQGYRQISGILVWAIGIVINEENSDFYLPILERILAEEEDQEVRQDVIREASKIGPTALPLMEQGMNDPDDYLRWLIMEKVRGFGMASIPILERGLKDVNQKVRHRAMRGLVEVNPQLELLEGAIVDNNEGMRCLAVYGARRIGEPAIGILKRALADSSLYVRQATVDDLAPIPPAQIVAAAIEDSDFRVRCLAALMAARLAVADALPILERAVRDCNSGVRNAAIYAAELIGSPARHLLDEAQ
jgi:HEAT repeat protein